MNIINTNYCAQLLQKQEKLLPVIVVKSAKATIILSGAVKVSDLGY